MLDGPPPMPPPLRAGTGPTGGPMGYKQFMGLLDDNVSPEASNPNPNPKPNPDPGPNLTLIPTLTLTLTLTRSLQRPRN